MKCKQKFWYGAWVVGSLALLALPLWWSVRPSPAQAAPADGTLLLGDSFKSVTPDAVSPGETAHYAIVLQNNSSMTPVNTLTVGDAFPELLTYLSDSAATIPAGRAVWNVATPGHITFTVSGLAPREVITLTFAARLSQEALPGEVFTNVASLDDGTGILWTNPATFTVSQPPAVQIAAPDDSIVIEQPAGSALTISGYAWNNFAAPPYLTAATLQPLSSPDTDGNYYVDWTPVPLAENYVLQEATSVDFRQNAYVYPALTAPIVSQFVANKTNGVYYYRVRAYNSQTNPSRWSNVQAITVTRSGLWQGFFPAPLTLTAAPHRGQSSNADEIVVEVSVDNGENWDSATVTNTGVGWDWSYAWTLPEEENVLHVLRARARDAGGGYGAEDSIQVVLKNHVRYIHLPLVTRRWPPIPYPATLSSNTDIARSGNYTLSWTYEHTQYPPTSDHHYELQEATHSDFNERIVLCSPQSTLCDSTRSLVVDLGKTPGIYYYRVRAWNDSGPGEWSNRVQITVEPPIPYAPTLSDIENADGNGGYTLNWAYTHTNFLPTTYEVQEATNADFTTDLGTPCTPGAGVSCAISGKPLGIYYYRVRGINAAGAGEWSVAKSVAVTIINLTYEFDGSLEGWGICRSDEIVTESGNPIPQPLSRNNMLYTMIVGSGDFAIIAPMHAAPPLPYTIVTFVDIVNDETINDIPYSPKKEMKYSIIFGANGDGPCPANEHTPKDQGCFSHYYRLRIRWNEAGQTYLTWGLQRIDYHEGDNDQGRPPVTLAEGIVLTDGEGWNKWKIEVLNTTGDNIKVYHGQNEKLIASARDTTYIDDPYFGVQIISPESAAVAARWDWFYVLAQ